ncbi:MAG: type II secretion system-associated lipoprotein [Spirochaetota bacterium]
MKNSILLTGIVLLGISCQKRLIRAKDLPYINEYYSKKNYYLKEDVKIDNKRTLKKGLLVKIMIDATPSLVKVKTYPAKNNRENSLGQMIAYLANDDFEGDSFTIENLDELIEKKLELYKNSPDNIKDK